MEKIIEETAFLIIFLCCIKYGIVYFGHERLERSLLICPANANGC
jgi:hypothetical protein